MPNSNGANIMTQLSDSQISSADAVDVLVAVDVGNAAARSMVYEQWIAADRAERAHGTVDAPGQIFPRLFERRYGFFSLQRHFTILAVQSLRNMKGDSHHLRAGRSFGASALRNGDSHLSVAFPTKTRST